MSLDVRELNDTDFEKLPKISVVSQKTNEVIQKPIFGRFNYRIYMPWRGWQALRVARRMALEESVEKVETSETENAVFQEINNGHKGLFDGYLINTLNQARLGFCDPKTCAPRTSFYKSPEETFMNNNCSFSEDNNVTISFNSPLQINENQITYNQNTEYNVFNVGGTATQELLNLFSDTVEKNISERYLGDLENILFKNSLKMIHRSSFLQTPQSNSVDVYISGPQDINFTTAITVASPTTKKIIATSGGNTNDITSHTFSIDNISSSVGGFGTFVVEPEDNFPQLLLLSNNILNNFKPTGLESSDLKCYHLNTATIQLSFKETDERYVVGDESIIHINLNYIFSPFAFPSNLGNNAFTNLSFNDTGFLESYSLIENQNPDIIPIGDWTCYSNVDMGSGEKCVAE